MRVLVTGGAGFIGSHIVDALVQGGIDVAVADNLATGSPQNLNPAARFYRTSITDRRLRDVLAHERPDAVIHEAAQTVVTRSVRDPGFDARVNILGSINLLEACVASGVRKVVYASSSAAYGTPRYLPVDEAHPLDPISPYGVSKQTVERYLHAYRQNYGLAFCALRYANVFGPRQRSRGEAGVIAIFASQMLSGQRPRIYGRGDKTRSYVYVGDVARANVMALVSEAHGIFNIGTDVETSDREVFDLVARSCAYREGPEYADERPAEIQRMCLDCRRAGVELGWRPEMTLEAGIAETVRSYMSDAESAEATLPK